MGLDTKGKQLLLVWKKVTKQSRNQVFRLAYVPGPLKNDQEHVYRVGQQKGDLYVV